MDQQDADGINEEGSSVPQEQSSAEQLKAEGVVGFYGQKSPSRTKHKEHLQPNLKKRLIA